MAKAHVWTIKLNFLNFVVFIFSATKQMVKIAEQGLSESVIEIDVVY